MKQLLLVLFALAFVTTVHAYEPGTPYLGDTPLFKNVTISSYSTTAIITTANMKKTGAYLIVNNGSYDVYLATFAAINTSLTNCAKLIPTAHIAVNGKTGIGVFGRTIKAQSYTSRLDVFHVYED